MAHPGDDGSLGATLQRKTLRPRYRAAADGHRVRRHRRRQPLPQLAPARRKRQKRLHRRQEFRLVARLFGGAGAPSGLQTPLVGGVGALVLQTSPLAFERRLGHAEPDALLSSPAVVDNLPAGAGGLQAPRQAGVAAGDEDPGFRQRHAPSVAAEDAVLARLQLPDQNGLRRGAAHLPTLCASTARAVSGSPSALATCSWLTEPRTTVFSPAEAQYR